MTAREALGLFTGFSSIFSAFDYSQIF